MFTLKVIIEIILIVGLIIGYINEEKIARWERDVLIPWIKEMFRFIRKENSDDI